MSGKLPNREQAVELLKNLKCPPQVIKHCLAVSAFAMEIAQGLHSKGVGVDLKLVEIGALLHDIGRSKSHGIDHALVGAQIAGRIGLTPAVINIIKRHVGGGISEEESYHLGWPKDNYIPSSIEEKIVCYADKRVDNNGVEPIENEIARLQKQGLIEAAERVRSLHVEINALLGDC